MLSRVARAGRLRLSGVAPPLAVELRCAVSRQQPAHRHYQPARTTPLRCRLHAAPPTTSQSSRAIASSSPAPGPRAPRWLRRLAVLSGVGLAAAACHQALSNQSTIAALLSSLPLFSNVAECTTGVTTRKWRKREHTQRRRCWLVITRLASPHTAHLPLTLSLFCRLLPRHP